MPGERPWSEALRPRRMRRVAIVAPESQLRAALERVGQAGVVELDLPAAGPGTARSGDGSSTDVAGGVARLDTTLGAQARDAELGAQARDAELGAQARDAELGAQARDAELTRVQRLALSRGEVAGVAGWTAERDLQALAARLAGIGAAVVPMRLPPGVQPPTQLSRGGGPFGPLVETYTTVPYRDVDPSLVAGLAYVAMFGMMFGDVGHGALLVLGALLVRSGRLPGRPGRSAGLRRSWAFLAGGGLASTAFGVLYGSVFGATGVVPAVWSDPLEEPIPIMTASLGVGAVLMAGAYALGTVNRVREGGWGYALYARTGVAGALTFCALAAVAGGLMIPLRWLVAAGIVLAIAGLVLTFVGLLVEAGHGLAAVLQAAIELFDVVVRLGANLVSFARLAAFGLTHAALGWVVWTATTALWSPGAGMVAAALVFVVGNTITFALEALVAGIQALRLEYYELFSRVFAQEGRPFRPWRLPGVEPTRDARAADVDLPAASDRSAPSEVAP
jgi:V/A-type H+/Na+-transporting ATPase subunit I